LERIKQFRDNFHQLKQQQNKTYIIGLKSYCRTEGEISAKNHTKTPKSYLLAGLSTVYWHQKPVKRSQDRYMIGDQQGEYSRALITPQRLLQIGGASLGTKSLEGFCASCSFGGSRFHKFGQFMKNKINHQVQGLSA
jgi:hypothetical protein